MAAQVAEVSSQGMIEGMHKENVRKRRMKESRYWNDIELLKRRRKFNEKSTSAFFNVLASDSVKVLRM